MLKYLFISIIVALFMAAIPNFNHFPYQIKIPAQHVNEADKLRFRLCPSYITSHDDEDLSHFCRGVH